MVEPASAPQMTVEEARRLLNSCELHTVLGLELDGWERGSVSCVFRPPVLARDPTTGAVHGGALVTALDTVAGLAVVSVVGVDITTVDFRSDFLRPALDDEFRVEGRQLRIGRRFGWGDAVVETRDARIIASGRGTFIWS